MLAFCTILLPMDFLFSELRCIYSLQITHKKMFPKCGGDITHDVVVGGSRGFCKKNCASALSQLFSSTNFLLSQGNSWDFLFLQSNSLFRDWQKVHVSQVPLLCRHLKTVKIVSPPKLYKVLFAVGKTKLC